MKAFKLDGRRLQAADIQGRVLAHDVSHRLRKGTVLDALHLPELRTLAELHLVELEPGEVHEDQASQRLAAALLSPGLCAWEPSQSQVRLTAASRGQLRVDAAALENLNRLPPVSVFTLFDGQAVAQGEEVAGCKVTPVAVAEGVLLEAERICARGPVLRLLPFRPLRTFMVVTEKLKPAARTLFESAVRRKLGWYGAELLAVRQVSRMETAIQDAYRDAISAGAELVLFAGASSIDPLDPAYAGLETVGGELLHLGVPAHPGSMLWVGRLQEATVLGIASCAGFGRNTALDLLLPGVFALGTADEEDLVRLGHGGLIESGAGRRFPPYESAD